MADLYTGVDLGSTLLAKLDDESPDLFAYVSNHPLVVEDRPLTEEEAAFAKFNMLQVALALDEVT